MGLTSQIIEFPGEWSAATYPASRSYVGRFTIQTVQSVVSSDERDVYRHLVDRNAAGRFVFIPDEISEEEADAYEVSPVTARQASLEPKAGKAQSQKIRFLLGEIWSELTDAGEDAGTKEDHYRERTQAIVKELSDELETLRLSKHYEASDA